MQSNPKYKIDEIVTFCPATLHNQTKGSVIEITKLFKVINPTTGKFIRNGLCTDEKTISLFKLPYTFDGISLIITYPSGLVEISKFYCYSYVVKTETILMSFSERYLKLVSK